MHRKPKHSDYVHTDVSVVRCLSCHNPRVQVNDPVCDLTPAQAICDTCLVRCAEIIAEQHQDC